MTFEKALSLAKTGKFLTLESWADDEFLCLTVYKFEKMIVKVSSKEIVRYTPTQKEMLSNGWGIAINADTRLINADRFKMFKYEIACSFIENDKIRYSILTVDLIKKIDDTKDLDELKVIIAQMIPSMIYNLNILSVSLIKD